MKLSFGVDPLFREVPLVFFSRPLQESARKCNNWQSSGLKREISFFIFHLVRRLNGRRAVCLSGRIPEFLAWPPSDFALQKRLQLRTNPLGYAATQKQTARCTRVKRETQHPKKT